jgi:hypothetical protein
MDAATIGQVASAIMAAIRAYGSKVLDDAEQTAADGTVGLGTRLLRRWLVRSNDKPQVEQAVADFAGDPQDDDEAANIRRLLKRAIKNDPGLADELLTLWQSGGSPGIQAAASGRGSTAIGNNSGINSTGDSNTNTVNNKLIQLPEPRTALHGIPPPIPVFSGRSLDLQEILSRLDDSTGRRRIFITGMPGAGKTALALQAASIAHDRSLFPGGGLYYDLRGYGPDPQATADEVLSSFLTRLGFRDDELDADRGDKGTKYRSELKSMAAKGKAVLLFLDNAPPDFDFMDLLPGDDKTGLIVTSRHAAPGGWARYELGVLEPGEAVALLEESVTAERGQKEAHRVFGGRRDVAREIARLCGYLPLALGIIAGRLEESPLDVIAGELAEADSLVVLDDETSRSRGVSAALDWSYGKLADHHKRVFHCLAVCPGADVAPGLVTDVLDELSPRAVKDALSYLRRAHLAEAGRPGHWRLHDLVRLYAVNVRGQERNRELDRRRVLDRYLTMISMADDWLRALPGEHPSGDFNSRPEALSWLAAEAGNLTACVTSASLSGHEELIEPLAVGLSRYLEQSRRFEDWQDVAESALAVAGSSGDDARSGVAHYNMGLAQYGRGRYPQAAAAFEQAAGNFRAAGYEYGTGRALTGLGLALAATRDFPGAADAHRRAGEKYHQTREDQGRSVGLNSLTLPRLPPNLVPGHGVLASAAR